MQKFTFILSYLLLNLCIAINAQTPSGVDLMITELTRIDTAKIIDDAIVVKVCAKNNGNLPYSQMSDISYYISTDTVFDKKTDTPVHSHPIDSLAAGTTKCYTETISLEYAQIPGSYYIIGIIDNHDEVWELHEDNNTKVVGSIPFNLRNFELQLDSLTVNGGTIIAERDFSASVLLKNLGTATSNYYTTDFYLSTDSILQESDEWVSGSGYPVGRIAGGDSTQLNYTCYFPENIVPGSYYLIARVSGYDQEYKTYDVLSTPVKIIIPPTRDVKLNIDTIYTNKTVLRDNEYFSLTALVTNRGTERSDYHEVYFYLSKDTLLNAAYDPMISGVFGNPALDPGASSLFVSRNCLIPQTTVPGRYYILARSFNTEYKPILSDSAKIWVTVVKPDVDLKITSLSISNANQLVSGQNIAIASTVMNDGSSPSRGYTWEYYFSKDSLLDAVDQKLKTVSASMGLAPYKSLTSSTSTALPIATPGKYYIIAKIVYNYALENDSLNNVYKTPVMILQPNVDLHILSVSSRLNVVSSSNALTTTVTEKNLGTTPSGTHEIAYYLSSDTVWSANDLHIGNIFMDNIAGGSTLTYTENIYLPANINGSYYLIAKTNPNGSVSETNTANNFKAFTTLIEITTPNVDLFLKSFVSNKATLQPGDSVEVSALIKNVGSSDAGGFFIDYSISSDTILNNGNEIYLDNSIPSMLGAQDSLLDQKALVIPENLDMGYYYLIASVNYDEMVSETSMLNNTIMIPIGVGVVTKLTEESNIQAYVYPNPSTGLVHVPSAVAGSVEVYDLDKRLVHSESISSPSISLESLANGIYLIQWNSTGNRVLSQKLVICK